MNPCALWELANDQKRKVGSWSRSNLFALAYCKIIQSDVESWGCYNETFSWPSFDILLVKSQANYFGQDIASVLRAIEDPEYIWVHKTIECRFYTYHQQVWCWRSAPWWVHATI